MADDLEPYENVSRVFWIKIELKENQPSSRQDFGDIRDILSGSKSSLKDPLDIIEFILPYMHHMGIRIGCLWRLTFWIKHKMKPGKNNSLRRSK